MGIDVNVLVSILLTVLMYPVEMVNAIVSIRGVADFVVVLITYMGLATVSWSAYSRWDLGEKVGTFFAGWIFIGVAYIFASVFNVNYDIMVFVTDSGWLGVFIALIPGIIWKDISENGDEDNAVKNIGIISTVFLVFLLAVAVGMKNVWYLVIVGGSILVIFLISLISAIRDPLSGTKYGW